MYMCTSVQDSGVTFIVEGERKQLRGTLTVVSADNPAAQLVGGYKQLHSATRKCRDCLAVSDDMQTKVMPITTCSCAFIHHHHNNNNLCSLFRKSLHLEI